jgi:putative two-component system response regulator
MIRTHPKKGYEILKKLDLPWPVADIVLQHHERMDGSGYPYQLRGEEIMMEARIIAVSDLVETMLTDRPYRKACALNECLEELESNKGILFDAWVVDITLSLIREENYFLKNI